MKSSGDDLGTYVRLLPRPVSSLKKILPNKMPIIILLLLLISLLLLLLF